MKEGLQFQVKKCFSPLTDSFKTVMNFQHFLLRNSRDYHWYFLIEYGTIIELSIYDRIQKAFDKLNSAII